MSDFLNLTEDQELRARELHDDSLVVVTYGGPFSAPRSIRGWRAGQLRSDDDWVPPTRTAVKDNLVPDMLAGGVDCVVAHAGTEDDLALWLREFQSSGSAVMQATRARDVREARQQGKVSFILNAAGARNIGIDAELNRILLFQRAGARIWALTHSVRNPISGGCGEPDGPGLTILGRLFVQELNEQRIAVDISHISDAGFWDVLEVSSAPIMATHSNSRSVCDHGRNLTDEMIKELTAAGGFIGLNFFPRFVKAEAPTVEHLVDHIDKISQLAGPGHVGLGPDFCTGRWGWVLQSWWSHGSSDHNAQSLVIDYPTGVEDTTQMHNVTRALVKRGYSDDDIRGVLGENFLRYFETVVGE
jgi:membrane dipeptidase